MITSFNLLLRSLLSRIFSISRRTWIFLSVTFLVVIVLLIWAAISTAGWLLGMARDSVNAAPEAVRAATAQVEQVIPGVHEKLGVLVPGLKSETPPREVSGTDPAPVARFPGLARVQWQRDDQQVHTSALPRQGQFCQRTQALHSGVRCTGISAYPSVSHIHRRAS